jgi:hypothetical protein
MTRLKRLRREVEPEFVRVWNASFADAFPPYL